MAGISGFGCHDETEWNRWPSFQRGDPARCGLDERQRKLTQSGFTHARRFGGQMKRLVLLAVLLIFLVPVSFPQAQGGFATDGAFAELEAIPAPPDRPSKPYMPAKVTDPRFDLSAQMITGRWSYNGNHEYKGAGKLVLLDLSRDHFVFRYSCANSFRPVDETYSARWITPGKKLEILMNKPGTTRISRCRLSTVASP